MKEQSVTNLDPTTSASDPWKKLSKELGFDAEVATAEARFQLEALRLRRGEPSQLGYVMLWPINDNNKLQRPVVVVFESIEEASAAITNEPIHPLIADLLEKGLRLESIPEQVVLDDLVTREIILV